MGRPKLENLLMNAERKKQWREKNKENKDETEKEKDRQRKAEKRSKLTNKEKEDQRERNKEYKRKSCANRYQKVLGTRLKDQNRKEIRTHRKESRKLVIHVRTILHQEYSSTERERRAKIHCFRSNKTLNCHCEIFQLQLTTKLEKSLTTLIG